MAKMFELLRRSYQAAGGVSEDTVRAWEQGVRSRLPEDYRRFLLMTNGGAIRPYAFDLEIPGWKFSDKVHALSRLYDWDELVEDTQTNIKPELRTVPPNRVAIGCTESELTLMIRLDPPHFGQVDAWQRDLFNTWGEGANTLLVPLAASFNAFMELLHDDPNHETYHGFWENLDASEPAPQRLTWP